MVVSAMLGFEGLEPQTRGGLASPLHDGGYCSGQAWGQILTCSVFSAMALPLLSLQLPSCASASHFQHPLSLLSSLTVQTLFTLFSVCAHTLIWLLPMSLFATLSTINIMPILSGSCPALAHVPSDLLLWSFSPRFLAP